MTDLISDDLTFSDDDLFFTCPHCAKNMAIEKRGMGLIIQCPECEGLVKVPKLSKADLKNLGDAPLEAESAHPQAAEQLAFLEEVLSRLKGLHEKHSEIEARFGAQQESISALQQEVQRLHASMETLSNQINASVV